MARFGARVVSLAMVALAGVLLLGCPHAPPPTRPASAPAETPAVPVTMARNQAVYLPVPVLRTGPASLRISGPGEWGFSQVQVLELQTRGGTAASPAAEQLLGTVRPQLDTGSTLRPVATRELASTLLFDLPPAALLRLAAPPTLAPGTYELTLAAGAASTPPATAPASAGGARWTITVSDLTLPQQPAILAVATTSSDTLRRLYPATFGPLQATYLDRAETAHRAAVAQLDALMHAAARDGVALFVEDLAPTLRLSAVGGVELDWDAYDHTMAPYLDGSAFADGGGGRPLPVWLVPVPSRRIRDSLPQLRQYWQACLEHARLRDWHAVPVLLHPGLLEEGTPAAPRQAILNLIEKDLEPEAVVVGTPDTPPLAGRGRLWATRDADRRLPPVGALATPESLRAWPWMVCARELRGVLWREAVGGTEEAPLLAVGADGTPARTARLMHLSAGLTDAAHFGLLAKRSDPAVVQEVLAGVASRTGLGPPPTISPDGATWIGPPGGYLYAGWPEDARVWQTVPAMLDRLIQATAPGQEVHLPPTDPLYLATKMWLAQAHRPVARLAGYQFALDPSREGPLLTVRPTLVIENPVGLATRMDLQWRDLPGNLLMARNPALSIAAYASLAHTFSATGHLESLREQLKGDGTLPLALAERAGGAILDLAAMVPVYRMRPTGQPLRVDGRGRDWPTDAAEAVYGPMAVRMRYAARPDLLRGTVRTGAAANVRWTFDEKFVYALIRCPQNKVSDQRNNAWPRPEGGEARWWGTDGVQIQIAGGPRLGAGTRMVHLAFKPSGVALARTALIVAGEPLAWLEGTANLTAAGALGYGITTDATGYTVELAIPRKWFPTDHDKVADVPLWRVNVLRHREEGLESTSWSGPVVNDDDVAMMGLLVGG